MTAPTTPRAAHWKWWVCGLLLLATTINYMDRQTLSIAAVRITRELQLTKEMYGNLELAFGWAFACGSLLFGFIADRVNVRWLYPTVLCCWSIMGFVTGLVEDYRGLLICRTFLGLFEAGHWPCALTTTQRLLSASDRPMGNSVLQSGASVGAILTPLVMRAMMTDAVGSWRLPFQVIGGLGMLWIFVWFASVRARDLQAPAAAATAGNVAAPAKPFCQVMCDRRFWVLLTVVFCIHTTWQLFRVWLPMFLQQGRGYTESQTQYFISVYYAATDVGCLSAGGIALWLCRRGLTPHAAKCRVFLACSLLTATSALVALLPHGWPLLAVLLIMGAGTLGLYPCYYSFVQEISVTHIGLVTGTLATLVWAISSPVHKYFGRFIDRTGSFDAGISLAGLTPILGFLALWLFWERRGAAAAKAA